MPGSPRNGTRGEMGSASIGEVFVGFIAYVVDPVIVAQGVYRPQARFRIYGPAGIVRGDRHHGTRTGGNSPGNSVKIGLKILVGLDQNGLTAQHADGHLLIEVIRRGKYDFFTRIGDGKQYGQEPAVTRTR